MEEFLISTLPFLVFAIFVIWFAFRRTRKKMKRIREIEEIESENRSEEQKKWFKKMTNSYLEFALTPTNIVLAVINLLLIIVFEAKGSDWILVITGLLAYIAGWMIAIFCLSRAIKFVLSKTSLNKEKTAINIALIIYMIVFLYSFI